MWQRPLMFVHRVATSAAAALFVVIPYPGGAQVPPSQATVTVRVESEATPLEGVRLTVSGIAGLTGREGTASLRLPLGVHELTAELIGYETASIRLVLDETRDTTVLVRMEVVALETDGIVVISGRTERRIEEEPLRIEAVPREEVEEKLLMTPGDIAMLLNETAGLRVQPTAPSLGGASVRIQGLRGRYTQKRQVFCLHGGDHRRGRGGRVRLPHLRSRGAVGRCASGAGLAGAPARAPGLVATAARGRLSSPARRTWRARCGMRPAPVRSW